MKSKRNSATLLRLLYGTFAGLLIGISALAIYLVQHRLRAPQAVTTGHFSVISEAEFDGAIQIDPPIVIPDFTLTNQAGAPLRISDLGSRLVLITFGFTNCPDICPLTLSDFQQVKELLGDRAEQVAFVFISVDGKRDSPLSLRRYFDFRDLDGITALTGDEEAVREFGAPFGLAFEVIGDASTEAYSVNHTAGSFLLDSSRRWIMRFHFGLPPDVIAAELRTLLS